MNNNSLWRNNFLITKMLLVLLTSISFWAISVLLVHKMPLSGSPYVIATLLSIVFCMAALMICLQKDLDHMVHLLFIVVLIGILVMIRGALLYYQSGDLRGALLPWVNHLRAAPGFSGLSTRIGDYNMPYLYILFTIAKLNRPELDAILIKFVSMMFDVLLAYFAMKLVSLRTSRINLRILAFILAFAIPTVVLNSAMWGQCDSIYVAFILGALYAALSGKSKLSYVLLGLAFSFKLQTIFVFPVFLIFLFKKKIKLKDCYLFFVTFFALLLPALIAGLPIRDALAVYYQQTDSYPYMQLYAINIWQLIGKVEFAPFNVVAILLAGFAVIALLYFIYLHHARIHSLQDYIYLAFLFSVIIPFLLPRMHDRYFFLADVLAVLLFLYHKKRWFVPIVVIWCSYLTYASYLMERSTILMDFKIAALALMLIILITLKDFISKLYLTTPEYQQDLSNQIQRT